jgi:hypothetical protein
MVWFNTAKGLPIGEWRIKIGQEGICRLCAKGALEIVEHGLM